MNAMFVATLKESLLKYVTMGTGQMGLDVLLTACQSFLNGFVLEEMKIKLTLVFQSMGTVSWSATSFVMTTTL